MLTRSHKLKKAQDVCSTCVTFTICAICCDILDSTQPIKLLHSGSNWNHSFHTNCIEEWELTCIKNDKIPCCPLCPGTPFPASNTNNIMKMLTSIKEAEILLPYVGIMICLDGECKIKLTNLKLCDRKREWEYNNSYHHKMSLWEIKQKILEASEAIYNSFGNTNETWKDVVTQMMYPKSHNLRVINTCYVIPPKCVSFGEMTMDDIDDTSTLRDIYLDYHLKLGEMKNDPTTDAITLKHITDIYAVNSEKIYDNGYVQFPMAWLAVHLDWL
jgi:hypothetical protein